MPKSRRTWFLAVFFTIVAYTSAPYTIQKLYIRASQFSGDVEVFLGPYDYLAMEFSNFYGHLKSKPFYSQIDDIKNQFNNELKGIILPHKYVNKGLSSEELLDKYQESYGRKGRTLKEINEEFYNTGKM